MASPAELIDARPRTWRWYFGFTLIVLVMAAMLVGAFVLYMGISESLQAEENLHATLFTIRLVEQFVHEHGRWPGSWRELEQMSRPNDAPSPLNGKLTVVRIGGSHGYEWPAQSSHLQECVTIDFAVDANTIINQNPVQFQAIKPRGPHYEYRDYGFVESLQATLKDAPANRQPTPNAH